jgi:malyl-CoA/(S)-citramalyl-CoA lyase
MRSPKDFFKPLAVGAPAPLREIPVRPSRMIHFFPASNEKMRSKLPDLAPKVDVLLANLEDGVPATDKEAARAGLVEVATTVDFGDTQFWCRVNSLDSPWGLDDLTAAVLQCGEALDVVMIPKVEGPEDIQYVDRLLAQLEAKAGRSKPVLVHAILETARGVANVEEICLASPRMQGLSLGPADLAANRRMKTTRVGGGHPDYVVRADPSTDAPDAERPTFQQDLWHYTIARMVDACVTAGILPYYGPFGDIKPTPSPARTSSATPTCSAASAPGALHPVARSTSRSASSAPRPEPTWRHAQRVIDAMGDGTGAIMLDGKMEDDASVQAVPRRGRARQASSPPATPSSPRAYGF